MFMTFFPQPPPSWGPREDAAAVRVAVDFVPACVCSLGGAAFPDRAAGEQPGQDAQLRVPSRAVPSRAEGRAARGAGATALEVRNRPHGAGSSGHGAGRGGHRLPPRPPRPCRRCSGSGLFKKAAPPPLCPSRRRCREAPAGAAAGTGRPETGGSGSLGAGAGPRRY